MRDAGCSLCTDAIGLDRLDGFLGALAGAGFTHASFSTLLVRELLAAGDTAVDRAGALLGARGVRPDWLHAPFRESRLHCDGPEGEAAAAEVLRVLGIAARLGARAVVIHPLDGGLPPEADPEAARARIIGAFRRFAEAGRGLGVPAAVENLFHPVDAAMTFAALEAVPDLAFCLDAGHASLAGGWERIDPFLPRAVALHLHDNAGGADEHLPPGEGGIDWAAVRARLERAGYHGVIGLEIHFDPTAAGLPALLARARAAVCAVRGD